VEKPTAQIAGVHLEGPYFAMEQRGAQDPKFLRIPSDGTTPIFLSYHDIIRIMTYAPELPGALELTQKASALEIVPAAGHSGANDAELAAAEELGLRHVIHLWSGQSTTVREGPWRKPGLLEASLASDTLTGEIIADNRHLPRTLLRLAYRCFGSTRLCVVSDATNGAGLPDGTVFKMGGMEYEVHEGVGMLPDRTSFAGSTTLLGQMISVLVTVVGVPIAEAFRMASLTPAAVIGIDTRKGSLAAGKDADIAIFNKEFVNQRTMIGGRWVYAAEL
jgi:N-acetylglucosamine-6-phosphate deacetylase